MKRSVLSIALLAVCGLTGVSLSSAQAQGGPPPFAGAAKITIAEAMRQAPKADPALVPYEKKMLAAEAQLKKNPKNPAAKKAYVEAAYAYGHATMLDRGKLTPPVQYRAALGLYNKALAVDPGHKPSRSDKELIEGIYKQMGMPVPK